MSIEALVGPLIALFISALGFAITFGILKKSDENQEIAIKEMKDRVGFIEMKCACFVTEEKLRDKQNDLKEVLCGKIEQQRVSLKELSDKVDSAQISIAQHQIGIVSINKSLEDHIVILRSIETKINDMNLKIQKRRSDNDEQI